jgi:hypothetical protein
MANDFNVNSRRDAAIPFGLQQASEKLAQKTDQPSQAKPQQVLQDQVQQAQTAQAAQAAELNKLATQGTQGAQLQTPSLNLPQEFVGVLNTIVKEGYETAKPPEAGKTGDQGLASGGQAGGEAALSQKAVTQEIQRDLQVIREFVRELNYLVEDQGVQIAQALNQIRVEQGGAFWQKVQEILQKGIPIEKTVLFQNLEKTLQELPKNPTAGPDLAKGMLGAGSGAEAAQKNPGKAILELLKGELNPQQKESFLMALQTLDKNGLPLSAQKLRSYLRRRGGLPEQDLYFIENQRKEIFQGPMPREEIKPVNWWYILLALGAFGTSVGLGLGIGEAVAIGGAVAVLMFVLSLVLKK